MMRCQKLRRCFTLFLLLLLHGEGSATTENNKSESNETLQYRLPRVTIPISYEIKLVPEIIENNFTFYGESKIFVNITDTTRNVTLHSRDLRIDENFTSLIGANGLERKPTKHTYENETNILVIQFDKLIAAGNYTLALKYAGNMTNKPEGIYNSSYTNEKDEKVWLVATKFTEIHARRAFPCWDEPDLKATFNLSLKHNPNHTAVSNMPVRRTFVDPDGKQWTNFDVTPIMSSYLLAFVVSDFDCLRDDAGKFNVCGRKEVLPQLKHSRDVSQRAIDVLGKYMDYKYNLPKLDQFAVPDATTGATENWGLIIYRESSFAYEPFVQPISGKEYSTLTVIHELAHQWIGNLVTPVTWQYSWIKEGLPTFLQYYVVDKLYPHWRAMDTFMVRVVQGMAFHFDNSDNYKPLEWNSDNPSDIRYKFSSQIYNRGGAIFHMMSNILTESVFKAGVVRFIKDNEYGSITSDDLWKAMQSAYNENNKAESNPLSIKEIMRGWVEQQGYPIVSVKRDYEKGKVVITQEGNLENHKSHRWWVPINFATKSNLNFGTTTPSHWLKPGDESLVIDGIKDDDWIIVNIQQSGYYRVNYDTKNWKKIAEWMTKETYQKIPVRNRAQMLDDLSFMAISKRENYTTFLDLASYLINEDDYYPWFPTMYAFKTLRRTMYDEEVDEELRKFVLGLMEKLIKKIGFEDRSKYDWLKKYKSSYDNLDSKTKKFVPVEKALEKMYKGEDFLTRRYRAKFLLFACLLGHQACLDSAKAQLRANIENATENPISPDLASWVNCYGSEGSENELMKNINGSDLKYLTYLGCSPNKTVLRAYVEKVLSGELNATSKQTLSALSYLATNGPNNAEAALNFIIDNFETIYNYFDKITTPDRSSSQNMNPTKAVVNDYIWRTRNLSQIQKLEDLIKKESSRMPSWLHDLIAEQTKKIQWSEENASVLGEWLHDHALRQGA